MGTYGITANFACACFVSNHATLDSVSRNYNQFSYTSNVVACGLQSRLSFGNSTKNTGFWQSIQIKPKNIIFKLICNKWSVRVFLDNSLWLSTVTPDFWNLKIKWSAIRNRFSVMKAYSLQQIKKKNSFEIGLHIARSRPCSSCTNIELKFVNEVCACSRRSFTKMKTQHK